MREFSEGTTYDVLVVGSGAAGSIAVKELTQRGLDVLLLEAGRDLSDDDFVPSLHRASGDPFALALRDRLGATLAGQHKQARRAVFAASTNRFLVNDRQNPYGTPRDAPYLWVRGRVLGGRLHSYGRVLMRMSEFDFRAGSRDGLSPDWPLTYDELSPYYAAMERFFGVYGATDGVATAPDGDYPHRSRLIDAEQRFHDVIEQRWPTRRVIPWRYAEPNLGRTPIGIVAARATGRLTTRTDAVVREVTVDGTSGLADGVVFVDRRTRSVHRARAAVVLLCASAVESVRLLLNSRGSEHPDGLGNRTGLLGRFLMDQAPSLAGVKLTNDTGWESDESAPADPFYPPSGGVFIPRFVNVEGGEAGDFARGFAYQGVLGRIPVARDAPGAGGLMGFGEMLPYVDNRVTLHARRVDAWGIPIPVIRCALHGNERRMLASQIRTVREMLQAAGHEVEFVASPMGLDSPRVMANRDIATRTIFRWGSRLSLSMGAAIHECGGARMGTDPATSILNDRNQVWDVPNLLVTDGASFVTSGSVGPTLTIMALTARAAEFVATGSARDKL